MGYEETFPGPNGEGGKGVKYATRVAGLGAEVAMRGGVKGRSRYVSNISKTVTASFMRVWQPEGLVQNTFVGPLSRL